MKYYIAAGAAVLGEMTMQDWLFVISLLISVIGLIRDYLRERRERAAAQKVAPPKETAEDG